MPKRARDEAAFKAWYQKIAQEQGLDQNPDAPEHFYDYRAAYENGDGPDESGHWPSQFKREGHPRMVVDGVNTKTGEPAGKYGNRQQALEYLKYMLSQMAPGGVAPKTAGDAMWDGTQDAGPTMFQADPVQRALYQILQQGAGGPNNATMVGDFLRK